MYPKYNCPNVVREDGLSFTKGNIVQVWKFVILSDSYAHISASICNNAYLISKVYELSAAKSIKQLIRSHIV